MRKIKNLVVGSGPAGLASAKALQALGQSVELIDVAYDLESDIEQQAESLSHRRFQEWSNDECQKLFPPPVASSSGVERRFHFGSDFPYRIPKQFRIDAHNCKTEFSHGLGGLGNVWGAAILPYSDRQLNDWPLKQKDLANSYQNVLHYMPASGALDGLDASYPLFLNDVDGLKQNAPTQHFFEKLLSNEVNLKRQGIAYGRARLAVDASDGKNGCRYCGRCLDGCAYGAIFNPRLSFQQLEREGLVIHKGKLVLELKDEANSVIVLAIDVATGERLHLEAERVFLAAGQYATTTILARSLNLIDIPIPIQDSQYFFFPFFSYKGHRSDIEFTLAEAFMEIENAAVSDETVHLQVYGRNRIIEDQVRSTLPAFFPRQLVLDRLYIIQGFLSSKDSGSLQLTLTNARADGNDIRLEGVQNERAMLVARRTQSLIRRVLLKFGLVPPLNLNVVPPGRSFHTGGSFPMSGTHEVLRSDILGRPAQFRNVHIVDSANFPNIAGSTIAYTIMANADRIVRSIDYS